MAHRTIQGPKGTKERIVVGGVRDRELKEREKREQQKREQQERSKEG